MTEREREIRREVVRKSEREAENQRGIERERE